MIANRNYDEWHNGMVKQKKKKNTNKRRMNERANEPTKQQTNNVTQWTDGWKCMVHGRHGRLNE